MHTPLAVVWKNVRKPCGTQSPAPGVELLSGPSVRRLTPASPPCGKRQSHLDTSRDTRRNKRTRDNPLQPNLPIPHLGQSAFWHAPCQPQLLHNTSGSHSTPRPELPIHPVAATLGLQTYFAPLHNSRPETGPRGAQISRFPQFHRITVPVFMAPAVHQPSLTGIFHAYDPPILAFSSLHLGNGADLPQIPSEKGENGRRIECRVLHQNAVTPFDAD
ncbi:hypothetical protein VUR80DRAFT_717 [Thermomyces stellatus]